MRKSLITIGLAAASLATMAGLTACGSSSRPAAGQAAPNPPAAAVTTTSAAHVLQADGYTVDQSTQISPAQALINMGVVDRATGIRGSNAEQVIIFSGHPSSSVPVCQTSVCTPAGMASEVPSQDPGTQARASGLVLRITGTAATFQKDGLPV